MNSMSQNRGCQSSNCNPCRPCNPCNPCSPQNCGCGNIGPLSITIVTPFAPQILNYPIASVTEDSNPNCCNFKVEFLGNLTISSSVAPTTVTLNFTLYKSCRGNSCRQPIGYFTSTTNIATANISQSQNLNFQAFACRCRNDRCCNYTLELTSISSTVATTLNISIFGILCLKGVNNCCC